LFGVSPVDALKKVQGEDGIDFKPTIAEEDKWSDDEEDSKEVKKSKNLGSARDVKTVQTKANFSENGIKQKQNGLGSDDTKNDEEKDQDDKDQDDKDVTILNESKKVNEDEFTPTMETKKLGTNDLGTKSGEWKENILERAASAFKKEDDIMQLVYGSSLKEKKKKTKIKKRKR